MQFLATESLWGEASLWACDSLNLTATTSNPDSKSPYDMWHGTRQYFYLSSSLATARYSRRLIHRRKRRNALMLAVAPTALETLYESYQGIVI